MSEDITQRLAAISQLMMEGQPFNDGDFTDIDAAIDEIERLRAALAEIRSLVRTDQLRYLTQIEELRKERDGAKEDIKDLQFQLAGNIAELDGAMSRERALEESVKDLHIGGDNLEAEIERLRADLKVMTEEHRLACEDRDFMKLQRDEARRWICEQKASLTNHDAKWWAQVHTWDCFEREQGANDSPPENPLDRLARLDEEVGF